MGTRSLGDRPWLVHDEHRDHDLELKDELLLTRRAEVLHTTDASIDAAAELARLVGAPPPPTDSTMHAIERAACSVQADLCLLQRLPDGWHLDASCLCFPTRWRLREKVGQHIAAVHGPVNGYDPRITNKVDRLFDQLTERPVWRRNWFLMTDPTLHQPNRPVTETIIGADAVMDDLYIRSERQTLRQVIDDWIVFTIRIQQQPLGQMLTTGDRRQRFRHWVQDVSDDFGARRHLTPPQRSELLTALTGS